MSDQEKVVICQRIVESFSNGCSVNGKWIPNHNRTLNKFNEFLVDFYAEKFSMRNSSQFFSPHGGAQNKKSEEKQLEICFS